MVMHHLDELVISTYHRGHGMRIAYGKAVMSGNGDCSLDAVCTAGALQTCRRRQAQKIGQRGEEVKRVEYSIDHCARCKLRAVFCRLNDHGDANARFCQCMMMKIDPMLVED